MVVQGIIVPVARMGLDGKVSVVLGLSELLPGGKLLDGRMAGRLPRGSIGAPRPFDYETPSNLLHGYRITDPFSEPTGRALSPSTVGKRGIAVCGDLKQDWCSNMHSSIPESNLHITLRMKRATSQVDRRSVPFFCPQSISELKQGVNYQA
ncbi:hypothetical protein K438DRAFT_1776100 [Mycena galopus ATCC 62051]|nr:hypothetical protein K438DRAFT_1776100 [Mycena galopus ATCC 62051]